MGSQGSKAAGGDPDTAKANGQVGTGGFRGYRWAPCAPAGRAAARTKARRGRRGDGAEGELSPAPGGTLLPGGHRGMRHRPRRAPGSPRHRAGPVRRRRAPVPAVERGRLPVVAGWAPHTERIPPGDPNPGWVHPVFVAGHPPPVRGTLISPGGSPALRPVFPTSTGCKPPLFPSWCPPRILFPGWIPPVPGAPRFPGFEVRGFGEGARGPGGA